MLGDACSSSNADGTVGDSRPGWPCQLLALILRWRVWRQLVARWLCDPGCGSVELGVRLGQRSTVGGTGRRLPSAIGTARRHARRRNAETTVLTQPSESACSSRVAGLVRLLRLAGSANFVRASFKSTGSESKSVDSELAQRPSVGPAVWPGKGDFGIFGVGRSGRLTVNITQ